jgi:anti-sigma factor RsiW
MHIHGSTLEAYLSGQLEAAEAAAIDRHVANCLACAHAIAGAQRASFDWERKGILGRLVRVTSPAAEVARSADPPQQERRAA